MVLVAGIDSSTQSCKCVIVDASTGQIVREGKAKHVDVTEADPLMWVAALKEAIKNAGGIQDIEAISVAGQQHGMVLLDKDGEVIRPAQLWNDTKAAQSAIDLTSELSKNEWIELVGSALNTSITISKVRWLAVNEPENAKKVAAICLPHDYLSWRLRGFGPKSEGLEPNLSELKTDRSDASGTGYFDASLNNNQGQYRLELLELALNPLGETLARELSQSIILPQVLGPLDSMGTINFEGNTTAEIGPGLGDNAAASLGIGMESNDVTISFGTSGVVSAISKEKLLDPSGSYNCFADGTGGYLLLGVTMNASRIVDAGKNILGIDYKKIDELALAAESGAQGLVLLPFFEGERTPNRPQANATLYGLTLSNSTPENIARAFNEGMILTMFDVFNLGINLGLKPKTIKMIGGSMNQKAVQAIVPGIFGHEIQIPKIGEYVALGAAKQANAILTKQFSAWPIEIEQTLPQTPQNDLYQKYQLIKDQPTIGELN